MMILCFDKDLLDLTDYDAGWMMEMKGFVFGLCTDPML